MKNILITESCFLCSINNPENAGALRVLGRPAEGYRKKVTCDYTPAAWRDGTINVKDSSQWESAIAWLASRESNGWVEIQQKPTFFLTLTFPACSGWLAGGGGVFQHARWHHFITSVAVPYFIKQNQNILNSYHIINIKKCLWNM